MTVEACLVLPVVFYVCIFIIYVGFYQYDRCVISQDAYSAALTGSSVYTDDNQKVYNTIWEELEEKNTDKYIGVDYSYQIEVKDSATVIARITIEIPFPVLKKMTGKENWVIEERVESKCLNPVFFIRACRRIS